MRPASTRRTTAPHLESEGDDPAGPYGFKAKLAPPNHADDFAIDAGILQLDGRLHLAYKCIDQYQHNGLNFALMSNPYTASGDAVAIDGAGGYPEVREGSEFPYRNGRVLREHRPRRGLRGLTRRTRSFGAGDTLRRRSPHREPHALRMVRGRTRLDPELPGLHHPSSRA